MTKTFSVSSTLISLLLDHASARGLDSSQLLLEAGIGRSQLSDPLHKLPHEHLELLCQLCERASGDRRMGCDMSHRLTANGLHGLNILMDSAPTLAEGLRCLEQFLPLLTERMRLEMRQTAESVVFTLRVPQPAPHFFWLDAALSALLRNLARRVGKAPGQLLQKVWITPQQQCTEALDEWGVAYEYASSPAFEVPLEALQWRHVKADEFFHRTMLEHWQSLQPISACEDQGLAEARLWLKSSTHPIEHIASLMGYSQPGNFTRAFRKQYGLTPRQYRQA
ncbi:AraC family transcriptional regulator ligand-binding domain-containing protein [Pseudomonas sp. R37(2017)]|uniref:AraC family transcriptional regulator ligand-binding domain-containing protein n=1 Tax=Pseudomonas sp. R37(2017) TaxID=1981685 RepID=UPI00130211D4|nr:AraC family transcriptional regulator ligand-binding domain-containing protein [Pseudomonas sp. R37(2017)]